MSFGIGNRKTAASGGDSAGANLRSASYMKGSVRSNDTSSFRLLRFAFFLLVASYRFRLQSACEYLHKDNSSARCRNAASCQSSDHAASCAESNIARSQSVLVNESSGGCTEP